MLNKKYDHDELFHYNYTESSTLSINNLYLKRILNQKSFDFVSYKKIAQNDEKRKKNYLSYKINSIHMHNKDQA